MTKDAPKPRVEVQQESSERLEVLELDRTPRPEKLARESAYFEGASEVAFHERAFRPRHPASLDEVRARVDALQVTKRALPDVPPPPELPPPPPPAPRPVPEALQRALAPHLPGPLVAVEPIFSSDAGDVVAAYWEEDGARRSREFLVKDGTATPVEDVSARVDALPPPQAPAAPPPPPAEEPKKRKLGLPFGRKRDAPSESPPEDVTPASGEKTRRFGFRKRGGA